MDIELNGENGVKAALQVNAKWAHCQIVFLTNYLNYATDVYEAEHVMFVLKEQFAERLDSVFAKIAHEREQHRKQLCFVCVGKQTVYLAPDEIYYFERRGRKTIIETVWGSYELFDKIEDIMKRLPEGEFVRCHNSYVVYLPNIKEAKSGTFQMRNGQTITISRGYEKETKTAFMRWVRGTDGMSLLNRIFSCVISVTVLAVCSLENQPSGRGEPARSGIHGDPAVLLSDAAGSH